METEASRGAATIKPENQDIDVHSSAENFMLPTFTLAYVKASNLKLINHIYTSYILKGLLHVEL